MSSSIEIVHLQHTTSTLICVYQCTSSILICVYFKQIQTNLKISRGKKTAPTYCNGAFKIRAYI